MCSAVGVCPCLIGKVTPIGNTVLMIDDHILDNTCTFSFKGINHGAQFCLIAETASLFEPVLRIISHTGTHTRVGRVRNPNKIEGAGQLISLVCKNSPFAGRVRVPGESLEHYPAVVGWPTFCCLY